MKGLAALALAWALASPLGAEAPADDKALAAELLAQADAPAREQWLEAHRPQLTPGLGREVAAQARVHYLASRYQPAYDAFTLAVRIGEIAGDPESRIRGLEGLGGVERFRGRSTEALPFLERAMREAEAAGDEAAVGRVLGGIGSARRRLGEFGAALALFERQLAIFERLGDTEWKGRAHNYIGIALGALGRCPEAIPHLEQSRDYFDGAGDAAAATNAYSNLGLCHQIMGNYAAALQAFAHCLDLAEASGKRNELGAPLNNIGELYRTQGAPLRALDYYRRSYAADAEAGEKDGMAEALVNEGSLLLELDRLPEARATLERSLALGEEIHSPSVITASSAGMAEVHWRLGDRRRALELLAHCLETAEATEEVYVAVRTRRQIAGLQLEASRPADALELAGRAADEARRYELREELWPALVVVGRADRALGQADAAEAALREAVAVVEELRANAVGPDADRAAFLVPHAAPYQELVSLLADGGRPWEALAVAERSKGRVLLDVLAGGRTSIGAALREDERVEERRLEASLLTVNSELRALLLSPKRDAARAARLTAQRAESRRALEDFRAREFAAHPELRVLRGESLPLERDDVRRLLGDGHTVLLEYALTDRHAYLFVLSAGPSAEPLLAVHRLVLSSGELGRLAADLRERYAARDLDFAAVAARLHRALLAPATDILRRARQLVIVPDGRLWELPFQALRPEGGRYLIEDATVSYAPSLSVLRDMRAHRAATPRGTGLLALGNPELGSDAKRLAGSVLASEALQPLPETESQVREIARLYDAPAAAVRVGAEARESWVKTEASRYRILHFATHGVLDNTSPLYSELVLAAPKAGDRDDGLLEAREILDLNLNADLAVLSACETGRGQAGAGEGLIGMTWAFFVAGCPATVASQWKVDAASTSRLMLAFHRGLREGRAPAEALRLAALRQLSREAERHPFHWAAFVAVGDAGR
ncbi:MAG: CHAT domain-containing protein [Solirubrobacterales bacterium]|jgi:CHAT domain-containing protein